ncbi:hypothetical protein HYY69_03930 [Candidatus Woesearchaeota archaeon]|nr:hypothetical protein [Candidatus Woesearchaeota archaeon]
MSNIKHFSEVGRHDIALVGGKGAQLGEMFQKFPIPEGFIVTATAYKHFIEHAEIQKEIMAKLDALDVEDTEALQKASEEIEQLIKESEFSDLLEHQIIEEYSKIGEGLVAVRSSATAEDLPEASFAGQQATFLNIKGKENVVRSVKECFASLFTARAIYYRVRNKFEHAKVLIAVVVQKMVPAKKAGVIFTANPINNKRDEMIIEVCFGLGEALVGGELTPDTYILKKTGEIIDKHISEQTWMYTKDIDSGKGTIKQDIDFGAEQKLNDDELDELRTVALNIEKHYGYPVDIEFAIAGGVHILQARPITTLK